MSGPVTTKVFAAQTIVTDSGPVTINGVHHSDTGSVINWFSRGDYMTAAEARLLAAAFIAIASEADREDEKK